MSYLINRNPSGRLICIDALVKYLFDRFGKNEFQIKDVKFDARASKNIHQHCSLLATYSGLRGMRACPFLENKLSPAKCYLTQSIQHDTQKSKSASDAANAIDGLGLAARSGSNIRLTSDGIRLTQLEFASTEWLQFMRQKVLCYGPFVGMLQQAQEQTSGGTVLKRNVNIGYPDPAETTRVGGKVVTISAGSTTDTITRTRAVLFAWAVTTGYLIPKILSPIADLSKTHTETLSYIKQKTLGSQDYELRLPNGLFNGTLFVDRPLSYHTMTKSTKALRERGQKVSRTVTMQLEGKIKNRRFAVVHALGVASQTRKKLDFQELVKKLQSYPTLFVLDKAQFTRTMIIETRIASIAGIPFKRQKRALLPLTRINLDVAKIGAPENVLSCLEKIIQSALI